MLQYDKIIKADKAEFSLVYWAEAANHMPVVSV